MDERKDDPFKPVKLSDEQVEYIRKILKITCSDTQFADKAFRAIRYALLDGGPVIDPFDVGV